MACDDQGSNSVVTDLRLFVAPTATALLKIAKGVKGRHLRDGAGGPDGATRGGEEPRVG